MATNFTRWANATEPYAVSYSKNYEPYFISPTKSPMYVWRLVCPLLRCLSCAPLCVHVSTRLSDGQSVGIYLFCSCSVSLICSVYVCILCGCTLFFVCVSVCMCVCVSFVSVTVCIRYDEMFRFWGNDKVSHVMELVAHGFQFVVLPNSMVVHIPHSYELPDQDSVRSFTSCSSLRVCVCVMCA
jgi:hypothetical protein